MGRFKKGLFLGGILGAGLMWLNATTRGKKTREEIVDHAAEVYRRVKEEIMASNAVLHLKRNSYVQMVEKYMRQYTGEHGLPARVADMVEKIVKAQWGVIQDETRKKRP